MSQIRGTNVVIDGSRILAIAVQAAPTRVVLRINISATEMQSILGSHVMIAAEGLSIVVLKTAKVLGVEISASLLARADEVIE